MITHYVDVHARPLRAVCGAAGKQGAAISVGGLILATEPCERCLEWAVEQGKQAAERLKDIQFQKEPHP